MTKPAPLPDWSSLLAERDATIKRLRAALMEIGYFSDGSERSSGPYDACATARAALAQEPRT